MSIDIGKALIAFGNVLIAFQKRLNQWDHKNENSSPSRHNTQIWRDWRKDAHFPGGVRKLSNTVLLCERRHPYCLCPHALRIMLSSVRLFSAAVIILTTAWFSNLRFRITLFQSFALRIRKVRAIPLSTQILNSSDLLRGGISPMPVCCLLMTPRAPFSLVLHSPERLDPNLRHNGCHW